MRSLFTNTSPDIAALIEAYEDPLKIRTLLSHLAIKDKKQQPPFATHGRTFDLAYEAQIEPEEIDAISEYLIENNVIRENRKGLYLFGTPLQQREIWGPRKLLSVPIIAQHEDLDGHLQTVTFYTNPPKGQQKPIPTSTYSTGTKTSVAYQDNTVLESAGNEIIIYNVQRSLAKTATVGQRIIADDLQKGLLDTIVDFAGSKIVEEAGRRIYSNGR